VRLERTLKLQDLDNPPHQEPEMRRKILFSGSVCLSIFMFLIFYCWLQPRVNIDALELVVDLDEFPQGWFIKSGPYSAKDDKFVLIDLDAIDFVDIEFSSSEEFPARLSAGQYIWNYGTDCHAWLEFESIRRSELSKSTNYLGGWSEHSYHADQFFIVCRDGVKPGERFCKAIARYGPFISIFSTPVGDDYNMTMDDLERIIKSIDVEIGKFLEMD
jgi:hypothetical protein